MMKTFTVNPNIGLVAAIQRFSLHDGPGIRTTVFFKGCHLRCPWCCNPENIPLHRVLLHDSDRCKLCGKCEEACPTGAIHVEDSWKYDEIRCGACERCIKVCPHQALSISGKEYDVDELCKILMKDKPFFDTSKGGITYSGGEMMMQIDFISSVSKKLKEWGIHQACESTASLRTTSFLKLVNVMDLLLLDLKHHDGKILKNVTGMDIENLKKNLSLLKDMKKAVIGRIPVIPGFNHSREDILQIATLARSYGILSLHLLPFHQLGKKKYEMMGARYILSDTKALGKEDLLEYKELLTKRGFDVRIGG